jgi:hypothetical protein
MKRRAHLAGLLGTAGLLLAAFLSPALASQMVVVEAKGSDLQPGQSVDGSAALSLGPGAKLVLVSEDGTTLTLKGPFSGAPEGGPGGGGKNRVVQSLAGLVAGRDADTTALGAARAAKGDLPALPEPWVWDAAAVGDVCTRQGDQVVLWRADAGKEAELSLMPADRSWTAKAVWPAGEATLALPAEVPLTDGGTFLVGLGGGAGTDSALTVHVAPPSLATDAMRAAWLGAKGCDRQLAALSKAMRK